jgi:hypothetical protein
MNRIPVFRKGRWISYAVPEDGVALWSNSLRLKVASVYATLISNGYSTETSTVIAECFANKELYGVKYSSQIETTLQGVFC